MSEHPLSSDREVGDHQVITRGGEVESVVVPLEEYRVLKVLEQRETELYWAVHEAAYPSHSGDDVPEGKVYDSMGDLTCRGTEDRGSSIPAPPPGNARKVLKVAVLMPSDGN